MGAVGASVQAVQLHKVALRPDPVPSAAQAPAPAPAPPPAWSAAAAASADKSWTGGSCRTPYSTGTALWATRAGGPAELNAPNRTEPKNIFLNQRAEPNRNIKPNRAEPSRKLPC